VKTYEKKKFTELREVLVATTCDWCGKDVPREDKEDMYREVKFSCLFATGYSYPDGGWMKGWQVEDLCEECAVKLDMLLRINGIRVSAYETDW
jgi:hypothetical protein